MISLHCSIGSRNPSMGSPYDAVPDQLVAHPCGSGGDVVKAVVTHRRYSIELPEVPRALINMVGLQNGDLLSGVGLLIRADRGPAALLR
jgi:hypothetical protein